MKRLAGSGDRFRTERLLLFFPLLFLLSCLAAAAVCAAAEEPVQVAITGVEGEVLEAVRASLHIPPGTVHDGEVNLPWLDRFVRQAPEKVQRTLELFGYFSARVSARLESVAAKNYILQVGVEPGTPARVAEVSIALRGAGAEEKRLRDLAASFPLQKGDVLLQNVYESAKEGLKNRTVELGYRDAEYEVHRIAVSRGEASARIELLLETGPRYFFGDASFTGADGYPEAFLRRYLAFRRGDVFSPSALAATQLNLISSDRFREVVLSPEQDKAKNYQVPVTVRLEPSLPKRLRFGAGYGTDTGARGTVSYKDLNVFGRGHEIEGNLNIAQNIQGLAAGYRIPGQDVDSFTGLTFALSREDVATYVSKRLSLELNRTYGFGQGRIGTAYVNLLKEDSVVAGETINARLIVPGLRFSQQRYDNLIRPQKGYRYVLGLRGTDRALGSDVGLVQVLGDGKMILPLPERLSLLLRAGGAATVAGDVFADLPASLRFFAGGDNSVRGYAYQSLGPQGVDGTVRGGRHLLTGSLEVERAILKDWGVAAFYDVGNAFNVLSDLTVYQGAGTGIRYYTPVGAIRLDVARQIGVENPGFRLHFTMGFQM